jgi:hypothetical protein
MRRLSMETAGVAGPDAASKGFGARAGDTRRVGAVARQIAPRRRDGRVALRGGGTAQAAAVCIPARGAPVEDTKVSPPGPARSKPKTPRAGRRRDRRTSGSFFRKPSMPRGVEVRGSDAGKFTLPAHRGTPVSRAPSDFLDPGR